MLEWILGNLDYVAVGSGAVAVIVIVISLILSRRGQRRFHLELTTALNQIQQQQGQLQEQQKLFGITVEQQAKSLQSQVTLELLHTQQEITALSKALRSTHGQGSWGELQLLTCLNLAGMQEHCDFEAQKTFPSLENSQRPDVMIAIPPDRHIAIDAKAPLETYLTAQKRAAETGDTKQHMKSYTKAVRDRINELAKKEYWRQGNAPEFVILFLPAESMFRAALEHDLALIEYGLQRKVMLASPTSLLTLLKVIAYGWSVESRGQNIDQTLKHQQEIYRHLHVAHVQWNTLRTQLDDTVKTFNKIMGAYADSVGPTLEAMRQIDITMKNNSPCITPIKLMQGRLDPVLVVPEELLLLEEEEEHMEEAASRGDDVHAEM